MSKTKHQLGIAKWIKLCYWKATGWIYRNRKYSFYGKRVDILVDRGNGTEQLGGVVVCDPIGKNTIILRDDGVIQKGGIFRESKRIEGE
jgi:hypothetical protein